MPPLRSLSLRLCPVAAAILPGQGVVAASLPSLPLSHSIVTTTQATMAPKA